MTIEALLRALSDALRAERIPFMLTGSIASAYHGAGRATLDVDFVVDPSPAQLDEFADRATALGMYVSLAAAHEALASRGMFNVVDPESGWKADFIIRKHRPFSEAEFARRRPAEYFGVDVHVATLEDLMISKLEWAKIGGSARQIEDVGTLLRLVGDDYDRAYLAGWVEQLGLRKEWDAAHARAAV